MTLVCAFCQLGPARPVPSIVLLQMAVNPCYASERASREM